MRRTYWYHEECLSQVETAVRTSKSPHHEICARCGYEGLCVEAELVTNPDVRKIEVGQELKKAAEALEYALPDTGPEVELPEESEAIVEAPTEAVEVVPDGPLPDEKAPEETAPEAEPEMISIRSEAELEAYNKAKNAKIAKLEAELEALRKIKI